MIQISIQRKGLREVFEGHQQGLVELAAKPGALAGSYFRGSPTHIPSSSLSHRSCCGIIIVNEVAPSLDGAAGTNQVNERCATITLSCC